MSASNTVWQGARRRIHMQEVGLRDGLQMEKAFVPTEDKIALCNALSAAGLSKIEVTSFTSPTAIPALKDAEIVMREITRSPGTVYTAKDIAEDPHYRARDMLLMQETRDGYSVEVPGIVPKLSATPGSIRSSAPHLGDDTDAVLAEMGLNAEQIALLRSKGVVQ